MNFIIIPEAVHLIGLLIPGVHKTITRQAYSSERTNVAMVFFLFNAYIGMGNDLLYLCACSIILWMSLCISFLLHEMGLANGTWTRQWISHLVLSRIVAPLIITGAFALIRSKTRPATEAQHAIQTMQEKEVEVSGPMTSNTAPAKSKGKEKLSAYEVAMALVASGALEPCPYISDSVEATIQVKIDNREPEDLVTLELRDLLQDSLAKHVHPDVSILNIYTRRGCVQLIIDLLLPGAKPADNEEAMARIDKCLTESIPLLFAPNKEDLGAVTMQVNQTTRCLLMPPGSKSTSSSPPSLPPPALIIPPAVKLSSAPLIKASSTERTLKINLSLSSPFSSSNCSILARHNDAFLVVKTYTCCTGSYCLVLAVDLPQTIIGGLITIECVNDSSGLIGKGCQVILLPSSTPDDVIEELSMMFEADPRVKEDLGRWISTLASTTKDGVASASTRTRTGLRLLSYFVARRMARSAAFSAGLLIESCGMRPYDLLHQWTCGSHALPLLHTLVRLADPHLLSAFLELARQNKVEVDWGLKTGPLGLTPLHLLALLPNIHEMAFEIMHKVSKRVVAKTMLSNQASVPAQVAWVKARCSQGKSPADFYSKDGTLTSLTELSGLPLMKSLLNPRTLLFGFSDPLLETSFHSFMARKCRILDLLYPMTILLLAILKYNKADPPISLVPFAWSALPYLTSAFVPTFILLCYPLECQSYSRLRTQVILVSNAFLFTYNILVGIRILPPPEWRWPLPRQNLAHLAITTCIWKINKAVGNQLTLPLALLTAVVDFLGRLPGVFASYGWDFAWAAGATFLGVVVIAVVTAATEWRQRSLFLGEVKKKFRKVN